jgi:hypothetical protein
MLRFLSPPGRKRKQLFTSKAFPPPGKARFLRVISSLSAVWTGSSNSDYIESWGNTLFNFLCRPPTLI